MNVAVSVPSLDRVTLSGSSTVVHAGRDEHDFTADLPGTGTLENGGRRRPRDHGAVGLGDGSRYTDWSLKTPSHVLEGTGDVSIHATSSLDAALTGVGSITYVGSPSVTAHNTGTGSITGV